MRLNYVPNPPTNLSVEDQQIVERVKARRGAKGLIPLDLTLLHSPKVADAWNIFLGAVRTKTSLTTNILEIAICRTLLVAGAWHEWNGHVPKLLATEGFTEEKLSVIKQEHLTSQGSLNDRQWAALLYTEHMSRAVTVPDSVFAKLKEAGFNETEIVELTLAIATYNMVSRVFVALDIAETNEKTPEHLNLV
ncbi:carboxymuconolactone decarboxylase [Biscogniauxia sp. FL1348]|nr:carboxymuconolactone decarboxylase [Biscogniauxia sp. FL1348]